MPQKPDYLVKITNEDDAKFFKEHLNELKKLQVKIEDSEKKRQKREDGSRRRYFPPEKELQDARFKEVEADLKHVKTEYAKNYIPKIEQKKEEVGKKDESIGAEVVGDILSLGDKNGIGTFAKWLSKGVEKLNFFEEEIKFDKRTDEIFNKEDEISEISKKVSKDVEYLTDEIMQYSNNVRAFAGVMASETKKAIDTGMQENGADWVFSDEGQKLYEDFFTNKKKYFEENTVYLQRVLEEEQEYERKRLEHSTQILKETQEQSQASRLEAERQKEELAQAEVERLKKEEERAEANAEFEKELKNRKIEGLKEVEAVQIDASGMQETLAKNNEAIAKRNEETEKESLKTRADQWTEYAEKVSAISQQVSEITGMVTNSLGGMFNQLSASYAQEIESLNEKIAAVDEEKEAALERVALTEDERRAREEELAQQKINLEYATSEEQKNKADERIATLQGELGAEDSINRDFESKKASLEKEKEKKEKAQKKAEKMQKRLEMGQAIVEAIGNIAQGAAKALSFGPILGPILAAVVSAAGAIQVGIMTKQLAKMEDGGLLRGKRHSQGGMHIQGSNIEVEGGEYVINRRTTQKNLGLMNYINSQHKELTPADINSYFSQPFSVPTFISPFSTMMEQGGQVPMLPLPTNADTQQILQAIGDINFQPRVAITDIHHAEQQMTKVDEWTGM